MPESISDVPRMCYARVTKTEADRLAIGSLAQKYIFSHMLVPLPVGRYKKVLQVSDHC